MLEQELKKPYKGKPIHRQEWREMPSDPPSPAQWNLQGGWMAAYHEAARRNRGEAPHIPPRPVQEVKVIEELKEEPMQGGWRFEGKEKPVDPKICPKCQGLRKLETEEEQDKSNWCEPCQQGKPGPGNPPAKTKKSVKDGYKHSNDPFYGS